jgi:hypothetical protein
VAVEGRGGFRVDLQLRADVLRRGAGAPASRLDSRRPPDVRLAVHFDAIAALDDN